ncbi:nuclear transport factor 2 family protein [Paraferrimonas sedimenticola]|uniref:SnoaL-like domain-containing protein n=1 Tax=Paraferrimonas sedimenticola TaxID=375674 RepID=A0AA37RW70_9GAMM|nr:nuclear transport factor 2 family protein [Paraferrimonas sedimenticola]GLP96183.1 hypothetical protein GCM10007895_14890 [Paraferrimonas sedimenticola]
MKIRNLVSALVIALTLGNTAAMANDAETEVLKTVHGMWDQARAANLDGMFAGAPSEHTYVMGGIPLWSKQETLELYQVAFDGVARQDIQASREKVTMLADDVAVYMADMSYAQFDANGNKLEQGPYAITVILKKRDGQWLNMHTHQSFPAQQ